MIGIIGAMESEVAWLKQEMKTPVTTKIAGMDFYQGEIEGKSRCRQKYGDGGHYEEFFIHRT